MQLCNASRRPSRRHRAHAELGSIVRPFQVVWTLLQSSDLGAITDGAQIRTFGIHEVESWEALISQSGAKQRTPTARAYPLAHDPAVGPGRRAHPPGEPRAYRDHEQQPHQGVVPGLARQSSEDSERLLYEYHCIPLHIALVGNLEMRHYSPGRTRNPSRRPSPPLTMTDSVPVRPATISTFCPRSWPTSTVCKWTVWSSRTTATCMPPAPRISAVAGSQRGGSARVMANCTLANMPGSRLPSSFGIWTSVNKVRDAWSSAPAVLTTWPRNIRPGNSGTRTRACPPAVSARTQVWGTRTSIRR